MPSIVQSWSKHLGIKSWWTTFTMLLGQLLLLKLPLVKDLEKLLHGVETPSAIVFVVARLGAVIFNNTGVFQIAHESFTDFLKDPKRPQQFAIDIPRQSQILALSCLRIINVELKFNICGLETSYILNSEVEGLDKQIEDNIPLYLGYACQFWASHMSLIGISPELLEAVSNLLFKHFLYWLEVLSLKSCLSISKTALDSIKHWVQVCFLFGVMNL